MEQIVEIKFNGLQVKKVHFDSGITHYQAGGEWVSNIRVNESFSDDPRLFVIEFVVNLTCKNSNFNISIEANGLFESSLEIDDNLKSSMFIRANAPAIAFPFLRAFISNLVLNAGYNPVILPSYNFLQMAEERIKG